MKKDGKNCIRLLSRIFVNQVVLINVHNDNYENEAKYNMNNDVMNDNAFDRFLKHGDLGFYNAFECVSAFIIDKSTGKDPINVFSIFIAVERNNIDYNQKFLTPKLISITEEASLGVIRQYIKIENANQIYAKLCEYASKKKSGLLDLGLGGEVHLGSMEVCLSSFVPHDSTIPMNSVLKNNSNGSYVIEFFDCDKKLPLKENKLYALCEKIYEVIPINLQSLRDRIGNIIFQFPSQILFPEICTKKNEQFNPHKLYVHSRIDPRVHDMRFQGIVTNSYDGIITGFCSREFTENNEEIELVGV